jgi:hypothetical protein
MIMVPIPVRGVAAIRSLNESHASEIFLLPAESPVGSEDRPDVLHEGYTTTDGLSLDL